MCSATGLSFYATPFCYEDSTLKQAMPWDGEWVFMLRKHAWLCTQHNATSAKPLAQLIYAAFLCSFGGLSTVTASCGHSCGLFTKYLPFLMTKNNRPAPSARGTNTYAVSDPNSAGIHPSCALSTALAADASASGAAAADSVTPPLEAAAPPLGGLKSTAPARRRAAPSTFECAVAESGVMSGSVGGGGAPAKWPMTAITLCVATPSASMDTTMGMSGEGCGLRGGTVMVSHWYAPVNEHQIPNTGQP